MAFQIHWVQCYACRSEGACVYDEAGRPEMPGSWRGMSPACCPDFEVYVCTPRCAMYAGAALLDEHSTQDVIVRRVEEVLTLESVGEMLADCGEAEGFNTGELEFLESIREQVVEERELTNSQVTKLTELWDRSDRG